MDATAQNEQLHIAHQSWVNEGYTQMFVKKLRNDQQQNLLAAAMLSMTEPINKDKILQHLNAAYTLGEIIKHATQPIKINV